MSTNPMEEIFLQTGSWSIPQIYGGFVDFALFFGLPLFFIGMVIKRKIAKRKKNSL